MNAELILFLFLAAVAIVAAIAMLFTRNAVYSALFLILNFSTIAVFYLLLNAPFIAMAQITVYAGAIMVLFLFVIMLVSAEQPLRRSRNRWQIPLAIILGLLLLGEAGYLLVTRGAELPMIIGELPGFGSPTLIGTALFNQYLLPFEITSLLLLVAMVGAIYLSQGTRRKR